jgi:hypothetical protein
MEITNLNMYQRLRDFEIPSIFLDEIFNNEQDLTTLRNAWESLKDIGLSDDEIAEKIKSLILDLDMFSDPNILDTFNSIKNGNNVTEN